MRLSVQTLRILQLFAERPDEPRYGLEVMDQTGLQSGTVYPALRRLEANGWLRSREEDVDAAAVGRPARRLYHLTPTGLAGAAEALEPFRTAGRAPAPVSPPKARFA
jgi:DNA-binding PadR family transcriptional regulator